VPVIGVPDGKWGEAVKPDKKALRARYWSGTGRQVG
jgi:hypothetical protein